MLVLHANWSGSALALWAESLEQFQAISSSPRSHTSGASAESPTEPAVHSFTVAADSLAGELRRFGWMGENARTNGCATKTTKLLLPCEATSPLPSDHLARAAGYSSTVNGAPLGPVTVDCLVVDPLEALKFLANLDGTPHQPELELSHSVMFWIALGRFVVDLLSAQRFVPTVEARSGHGLHAMWQPWLHDRDEKQRVEALISAMPPVIRANADRKSASPVEIVDDVLRAMIDAYVRQTLTRLSFSESLDDRSPDRDSHVAWLTGLLGSDDLMPTTDDTGHAILRLAERWVSRLDEAGEARPFHLLFRLHEPSNSRTTESSNERSDQLWEISFHLQATDDSELIVDASSVWDRRPSVRSLAGTRKTQLQDLLLAELARAGRMYPLIESALSQREPDSVSLNTLEAFEFLNEMAPVFEESGFAVDLPSWWGRPEGQLGLRLQIEPAEEHELSPSVAQPGAGASLSPLGLESLVQCRWQVVVGGHILNNEELNQLQVENSPLVSFGEQWIHIHPDQLKQARALQQEASSAPTTLLEAMRLSSFESHRDGLPVFGIDPSGWLAEVLAAEGPGVRLQSLPQPKEFVGTLRPYQLTGLSWLDFLDRLGFGACLADDMGLGKTIQMIALLLLERQTAPQNTVPPTLLIVPTSVVSNWVHELKRFSPHLNVHVHYGPGRSTGSKFLNDITSVDVVITTYALASRDHETLALRPWHRIALDEAQFIKNSPTKQARAIRSLSAGRRVALTGTPVENRLTELWSIMDFCNPGYLGTAPEFRRRFAVPIERARDPMRTTQLRQLVRPFILRRMKTDPSVISDLPDCLQTREFATLTASQAAMYEHEVGNLLGHIESSEGIQRRGMILATLTRLKQICNHPQLVVDKLPGKFAPAKHVPLSMQSGKSARLIQMLEEITAEGDKALIFTQFRQMGHLLVAMIQQDLGCEALFLHGGTPQAERSRLVDRFQTKESAVPVFVLSLRAGGFGLNLTAANHVFHFDRWWNPAVENQATDRAFRIGQVRNVHVHKFVCQGTLEDRIDEMLEHKSGLASSVVGTGEQWLTEMSTAQLRDVLTLRQAAVETES